MIKPLYNIRPDERLVSGAIYLGALIPIWGVVIAWVVREAWRERSRHVVFHSIQAIWWQASLLLAFVIYVLIYLAARILSQVESAGGLGSGGLKSMIEVLQLGNDWIIIGLLGSYALSCLLVAWLTLEGRFTIIPIIGPRIYRQIYGDE